MPKPPASRSGVAASNVAECLVGSQPCAKRVSIGGRVEARDGGEGGMEADSGMKADKVTSL